MLLTDLLAPHTADDLARAVGAQPLVSRGAPDRHARWFGWPQLNDAANSGGKLRVYRASVGFVDTPTAAEAIRQLRGGGAVVLEDADRVDARLATLADTLSAELDEPTRVNVYATTPTARAFPLHADTHAVLVLQIAGEKRWRVLPPTVRAPLFHASLQPLPPPADDTGCFEVTLRPGDTLFVPRGHWHEAVAVGGPSLHCTVAIFAATGIDLAGFVVEQLFGDPRARAALPLRPGPALREAAHPSDNAPTAPLRAALEELLSDPTLLPRFYAARVQQRQPRRPYALPAHLHPTLPQRVALSPGGAHVELRDDAFAVVVPGRRLLLPLDLAAPVRRAMAGPPVGVDALQALVDPAHRPWLQNTLLELLAEGVLRPAP